VDVLKVGHHGSRGSSTAGLLDAVCPRLALLSCGRDNRFGHPARETLAALAARRIPVYRTDLQSDARVELLPEATRLTLRGVR
jgi:competence protein ComEC